MQYPKAVRKELNTIASTAYERELDGALGDLFESFRKWKNKQIDSIELNQLIHEFHQKKSREIWNLYNDKDEDFIVIRAVRLGLLKPEEISAKTTEAIHLDGQIK